MISELRGPDRSRYEVSYARTVGQLHPRPALGAIAGANLFWAEVGGNLRDVEEKTEEGRGETVESCRKIFSKATGELEGPSRFYDGINPHDSRTVSTATDTSVAVTREPITLKWSNRYHIKVYPVSSLGIPAILQVISGSGNCRYSQLLG